MMQNFITDILQFTDTAVLITGKEHHHATRSCRVRTGELIGVTDGCGKRVEARIETIDSSTLTARIERDVSGVGEPSIEITVALALISPARFETAVEKCTELGVRRFAPVLADRCTFKPDRLKLDRLGRIAEAAAKQAGRSYIPEITEPVSIRQVAEGKWGRIFAARKDASPLESAPEEHAPERIAIVVGPEGDFSDKEKALLSEHGALFFSLGGLTLRSETAAIAATVCAVSSVFRPSDTHNDNR